MFKLFLFNIIFVNVLSSLGAEVEVHNFIYSALLSKIKMKIIFQVFVNT